MKNTRDTRIAFSLLLIGMAILGAFFLAKSAPDFINWILVGAIGFCLLQEET